MKKVLFLCTANYYRSRFAEQYFNWLAAQTALDWQAALAGAGPEPVGRPASHLALHGPAAGGAGHSGKRAAAESEAAETGQSGPRGPDHRREAGRAPPDGGPAVSALDRPGRILGRGRRRFAPPEEALPLLEHYVRRLATQLASQRMRGSVRHVQRYPNAVRIFSQ